MKKFIISLIFLNALIQIDYAQNKSGRTTTIYYQEQPGLNRIATTDGTYISFKATDLAPFASQPKWLVKVNPSDNWSQGYPYLTYLGTDGNIWKTYIHASTIPLSNSITLDFESMKYSDDSGNNNSFQFVDWNGAKWNVQLEGIPDGSNLQNVYFIISPL